MTSDVEIKPGMVVRVRFMDEKRFCVQYTHGEAAWIFQTHPNPESNTISGIDYGVVINKKQLIPCINQEHKWKEGTNVTFRSNLEHDEEPCIYRVTGHTGHSDDGSPLYVLQGVELFDSYSYPGTRQSRMHIANARQDNIITMREYVEATSDCQDSIISPLVDVLNQIQDRTHDYCTVMVYVCTNEGAHNEPPRRNFIISCGTKILGSGDTLDQALANSVTELNNHDKSNQS